MSGRVVKVVDLGGDKPSHKKAKSKVAKTHLEPLLKEYVVVSQEISDLNKRKEALKAQINERLSKENLQEDEKGNKLGHYANFNVKQEIRRKIVPIPYEQLDEKIRKWADKLGLYSSVSEMVLDESKVDELVADEQIVEDDIMKLVTVTPSYALKISEDDE